MSADILLYVLVAAGLVFWLKTILGTREEDDLPSKNIFDKEEGARDPAQKDNNVVSLDALVGGALTGLPRHMRIDNKTTENFLEDYTKVHKDFNLYHFATGAEQAFEIIIEAFADGDKKTLKDLLADSVYAAFEKAIDERDERGEIVGTDIQSIEKLDIIGAEVKDDILMITVRFTAREICVIRNNAGEVTSGDPDKITEMVDVWVFGRDIASEGPEWYLYETRDDEIEDHKTPIPEAGKDKK